MGDEISNLPKNKIDMIEATLDKNNLEKVREKLGFLNDKDDFNILLKKDKYYR